MGESSHQHTKMMLSKNKLHIKKKFGQNFLIDDNVINKIVDGAMIDKNTAVIEIGPGLGSMTMKLAKKAKQVLAYEIDDDLIQPLEELFSTESNITLIHGDVLKRELDNDITTYFEREDRVVVVANLPYYITTPILFKCLEEADKIDVLTLMTQYEVAKRLTASKGTKDYNALSVLMHYKTNSSFEFKVNRTVFMPPPNVDSAVIKLDIKKSRPNIDEPFFFDFIKEAFRQKRKTLINNLHQAYFIEKDVLKTLLRSLDIEETVRAEALGVQTLIALSERIRQDYF